MGYKKKKKPTTFLGVNVESLLRGLIAANSIDSYARSWRMYAEVAETFEQAMQAPTLVLWRQHLIEQGYSANSVNIHLHGVKSIVRRLAEAGKIHRHVYHDLLDVANLPRNALLERRRPHNKVQIEPEQMRALCKAPPVSEENVCALRDRAFMMTLATTGCRLSEATNIKFHDIVKRGDSYVVTNIVGKWQSEPRSAPLSKEAYSAIMDWMEFRPVASPFVFTGVHYTIEGGLNYSDKPVNRNHIAKVVKQYAAGLGMPHVKPHDFRRFVATQLIKKKGIRTAQKVLGHASIATTALYDTEDFGDDATEGLF